MFATWLHPITRSTSLPGVAGLLLLLCHGLPPEAYGQSVVDLTQEELPSWRLGTELLRIGSLGGEHDAFVSIGQLGVDDEGLIWVLDVRLPALLVYDKEGAFVRQIGRRGPGPGEYRRPGPFGFLGDTVWIADANYLHFYKRDGTFLEAVAFPNAGRAAPSAQAAPSLLGLLGPDEFLALDPLDIPDLRGQPVGRVFVRQYVIRRNLAGTVQDTVVERMSEPGVLITANGILIYPPVTGQPIVSYYPDTDEIVEVLRPLPTSAVVGDFTVSVRRRDGTHRVTRTFRFRPVRLPESVRDSMYNSILRNSSDEQRKVVREYLPDPPRFFPPVSAIIRGEDGRFWVARERFGEDRRFWVGRERFGEVRDKYLILDADLRPVAEMLLPSDVSSTKRIEEDHMWVVEKDDFDVQYLVKYRIEK